MPLVWRKAWTNRMPAPASLIEDCGGYMRDYEVTIENRKNTIWSNFLEPIRMVVSAESKKQAVDLAYEIFQPEYRMSREKVKITAEKFNG